MALGRRVAGDSQIWAAYEPVVIPSCSAKSRSCSRHHLSAGARLRILASAPGCWRQDRSTLSAAGTLSWLTSPNPSTPATASDATPLAHSSKSPDDTMASKSGRCDWPLNSLTQFVMALRRRPLRPALLREMLCVHQTNRRGSEPVSHVMTGTCPLHVGTASVQIVAAPHALRACTWRACAYHPVSCATNGAQVSRSQSADIHLQCNVTERRASSNKQISSDSPRASHR